MKTKATLLYVEDEENDIFFMRLAFKEAGNGLSLQCVTDGPAAIAYLSGADPYSDRAKYPFPKAVLLDLNLPLISGFDVLRWIRKESRCARLPVIIFSSSGRSEDCENGRLLGADDYLTKPSSGVEFRRIVHDISVRWLSNVGSTITGV